MDCAASGRVVLVGAGPGDPELITRRGLRWLQRAEVVVYDQLVSPELLDEAPPDALQVFAGKSAGNHCMPQESINALLVPRYGIAGAAFATALSTGSLSILLIYFVTAKLGIKTSILSFRRS